MNQQDKMLLEWQANQRAKDLFEQGMFSNLKLDNQSEELNKMSDLMTFYSTHS